MGINLGTYNIWDGRRFRLPQAIGDIEQGNYDLMLLTETNVPEALYCHNLMGYDVIFLRSNVTTAMGSQRRVGIISRENPGGGVFSSQ